MLDLIKFDKEMEYGRIHMTTLKYLGVTYLVYLDGLNVAFLDLNNPTIKKRLKNEHDSNIDTLDKIIYNKNENLLICYCEYRRNHILNIENSYINFWSLRDLVKPLLRINFNEYLKTFKTFTQNNENLLITMSELKLEVWSMNCIVKPLYSIKVI